MFESSLVMYIVCGSHFDYLPRAKISVGVKIIIKWILRTKDVNMKAGFL